MNRKEKINYIKNSFPSLYTLLQKKTPDLIQNPENATDKEIDLYNQLIVDYIYEHSIVLSLVEELSF